MRTIRQKFALAFSVILAIQVVMVLLVYGNTVKQQKFSNSIVQAEENLSSLNALRTGMLNAETGQRGYLITGLSNYLKPYETSLATIEQSFGQLQESMANEPAQTKRLEALEPLIQSKLAELRETIDLRRDKGFQAAQSVVLTDRGRLEMQAARALLNELREFEKKVLISNSDRAHLNSQATRAKILWGGIATALFTLAAGFFLTQSIASPLASLTLVAQRIADGDLKVEALDLHRDDEMGALNSAFVQMTTTLRNSITKLASTAGDLKSTSDQILASSTQVASSVAQTASAIQEVSSTIEELLETAQLSSQKAKEVSDSSRHAVDVSAKGRLAAREATEEMARVRDQMAVAAATVSKLGEQGQTIGGLVGAVAELAEQSNILAVNAAIEAARSGEQGFAVVAQEIRSLSGQSKQATKEVRAILGGIQKATGKAALETQEGSQIVKEGVKRVEQADASIESLSQAIERAASNALQIEATSHQQVTGIRQIGMAMRNLEQASSINVVSATQIETASRNLNQMSESLEDLIGQFKV